MRCPVCNDASSRVVDSRPGTDGSIRRRRACEACGERFTTYERIEGMDPMVVKRDGRRELFEREKVRRSLRTACRKRPVSADAIERMVDRVASRLGHRADREVASSAIGEALLTELAQVDEVSYARFASVYLRFERLEDFATLRERQERDEEDPE